METITKVRLFVVLRALDRLSSVLQKIHAPLSPEVVKFVDELWFSLAKDKIKIRLGPVKKASTRSIVDEQEATYDEVVRNMYLYIIGDMIEFVKGKRIDSLKAADERVLDLYDYIAGQKYLRENKGGKAVIFTKNEEEQISADLDYRKGIEQINDDEQFAQTIFDWNEILSHRY